MKIDNSTFAIIPEFFKKFRDYLVTNFIPAFGSTVLFISFFLIYHRYHRGQIQKIERGYIESVEGLVSNSSQYLERIWDLHRSVKLNELLLQTLEGDSVFLRSRESLMLFINQDFCTSCTKYNLELFQNHTTRLDKYIVGSQVNISYLKHLDALDSTYVLKSSIKINYPFFAYIKNGEIVSFCPITKSNYEISNLYLSNFP